MSEDEFNLLYYSITIKDMTKVLTIWSTNMLFNSTVFTYIFKIKDEQNNID